MSFENRLSIKNELSKQIETLTKESNFKLSKDFIDHVLNIYMDNPFLHDIYKLRRNIETFTLMINKTDTKDFCLLNFKFMFFATLLINLGRDDEDTITIIKGLKKEFKRRVSNDTMDEVIKFLNDRKHYNGKTIISYINTIDIGLSNLNSFFTYCIASLVEKEDTKCIINCLNDKNVLYKFIINYLLNRVDTGNIFRYLTKLYKERHFLKESFVFTDITNSEEIIYSKKLESQFKAFVKFNIYNIRKEMEPCYKNMKHSLENNGDIYE